MHPSIATNRLAFTILFDFIAVCEYPSTCFRYTFLRSLLPTGRANSSPPETRHFIHSPTWSGRGSKVPGDTLRTHSRRITCEARRRPDTTPACPVSFRRPPVASARELRSRGWGLGGSSVVQEKGDTGHHRLSNNKGRSALAIVL
uniref:Uncharacterized protein n=1 Tax=Pipistrellus kuhlii TaxID=59472 RepID=A0A7J8B1V4_PIPKU|nr:hypothetical protein mPipKuh1_007821 [Pipistrellus kuhlii]